VGNKLGDTDGVVGDEVGIIEGEDDGEIGGRH